MIKSENAYIKNKKIKMTFEVFKNKTTQMMNKNMDNNDQR